MLKLTSEQKQFIDDHFYETQADHELDKQKFDSLTTPYELHYLADQHNWDDGVKVLQWVVESTDCSEATALQIFWWAQPMDFQNFKLAESLKNNYADETFSLIIC